MNPFEIGTNEELDGPSEDIALVHIFSPTVTGLLTPILPDRVSQRSVDLLLLGNMKAVLYPLRVRWKSMVEENAQLLQDRNITVQTKVHPGYFRKRDPGFFSGGPLGQVAAPPKRNAKNVFPEYVAALQSAKVLLTDSSSVHYSLQKYTEAMAAGVLLVGDIPHDRMNVWRNFAVEVPSNASNAKLLGTALWWVEHEEERLAKTKAGQEWAMQAVMMHPFWIRFNQAYHRVILSKEVRSPLPALDAQEEERIQTRGFVGKSFPFPFYVRCRLAGGQKYCKGQADREQRAARKLPHFPVADHPSHGGAVPPLHANFVVSQAGAPAYSSDWKPLRWLLLHHKWSGGISRLYRMLLSGQPSKLVAQMEVRQPVALQSFVHPQAHHAKCFPTMA